VWSERRKIKAAQAHLNQAKGIATGHLQPEWQIQSMKSKVRFFLFCLFFKQNLRNELDQNLSLRYDPFESCQSGWHDL
jgi:hypothetical protein